MLRFVAVLAVCAAVFGSEAPPKPTIVLIGATGNLARKYLWQALFDTHVASPASPFFVVAGARQAAGAAKDILADIFDSDVRCSSSALEAGGHPAAACDTLKSAFVAAVPYFQLKTGADYSAMEAGVEAGNPNEVGRVFYLSIVPKAYASVAALIAENAMPAAPAWARLVVEKPIGDSGPSAATLLGTLETLFTSDQILCVDHYLGARVDPIVEFRAAALGTPLDTAAAASYDVVMTESETCAGRTWFYNDVGVVRDVMQNHASELFSHATADLFVDTGVDADGEASGPSVAAVLPEARAAAMGRLQYDPARARCPLVVGQYRAYPKHVAADGSKGGAHTPTAATVVFTMDDPHSEHDIGVMFTAGKGFPRKDGYVAAHFDATTTVTYGIAGHLDLGSGADCAFGLEATPVRAACRRAWTSTDGQPAGSVSAPFVAVTGSSEPPVVPPNWSLLTADNSTDYMVTPGPAGATPPPGSAFSVGPAALTPGGARAYGTLFMAAVDNDVSRFVTPGEVSALWAAWDPVIAAVEGEAAAGNVVRYDAGESGWLPGC